MKYVVQLFSGFQITGLQHKKKAKAIVAHGRAGKFPELAKVAANSMFGAKMF